LSKLKSRLRRQLESFALESLPVCKPRIEAVHPHDVTACTQGLVFYQDRLYESVGSTRCSTLRRVDVDSGEVLSSVPIENDYAEGIAILDDRLVQLSWKSGIARVFDLDNLNQVDEFNYSGEGWGLASDTSRFFMSNGSHRIELRNHRFDIVGRRAIRRRGIPMRGINDLEVNKDSILMNVIDQSYLLEYSINQARISRKIDCSELVSAVEPQRPGHVLNGIAYRGANNSYYLTGKYWKSMFRVTMRVGQ